MSVLHQDQLKFIMFNIMWSEPIADLLEFRAETKAI